MKRLKWLADAPALSLAEKQMLANWEAFTQWQGEPLAQAHALAVADDRVVFEWPAGLDKWLDERWERWEAMIEAHQPFGERTALTGWREPRVKWSCQIVKHKRGSTALGEADFDRYSPAEGLVGLVGHAYDWVYQKVTGRRTSPWRTARSLRKRGVPVQMHVGPVREWFWQ